MTALEEMFASRISKEAMIQKVNENHESFEEAMQIALSSKEPQCWRAAWILGHCTKKNDLRLPPHADKIIATIGDRKDGHQRELIKILIKIKLTDDQEGRLFDRCMSIWEAVGKSPSVRHFAFFYISDLAAKYPELKNEITFLIQPEYLDTLSPGIRRSIEKRIAKL